MVKDYLKSKRILLVDDETELLAMLINILKEDGYTNIETATSVKDAIQVCERFNPELAVLDVNLEDGSGFELMEALRKSSDFPILFLTARGDAEDKFYGLGMGADDYMIKPFLPKELTLRIGVILKRCYKNDNPVVSLAGSEIDFEKAEVKKNEEIIPLTAKEHDLLSVLYRNAGKIVTMDSLCEAAWGENPYGYENSLMAHIRRIREKIEVNPSKPESLVTVKGLGYKLILKERDS